ncbi:MAG: hypothetical protein WCR52_14365 [Bacteroidota bacterium]
MKNEIKQGFQLVLKLTIVLLLLVPAVPGISSNVTPVATELACPTPNVSKTGQGSGSISFAWGPVSGAASYNVWYVRKDNNTSSAVFNTATNSFTFSGLEAGNYRFYFSTVCADGSSEYVIIDELVIC